MDPDPQHCNWLSIILFCVAYPDPESGLENSDPRSDLREIWIQDPRYLSRIRNTIFKPFQYCHYILKKLGWRSRFWKKECCGQCCWSGMFTELFTKKIFKKLLRIWSWDPGSGSATLVVDPDPGSGSVAYCHNQKSFMDTFPAALRNRIDAIYKLIPCNQCCESESGIREGKKSDPQHYL
jgi:hypothetical protein